MQCDWAGNKQTTAERTQTNGVVTRARSGGSMTNVENPMSDANSTSFGLLKKLTRGELALEAKKTVAPRPISQRREGVKK